MVSEVAEASATLTNSIIGVTVLAMPYCFAQCGFVLASLLLVVVSLATVKSSEMLLTCALATKRGSYEFLAHHVYGPAGKLLVEISMIGLSLGTLVAFHIIVGDLCPEVVSAITGWGQEAGGSAPGLRPWVMAAFAGLVILPLSLMRDPSSLSKISFVSLAFYGLFLLHLLYQLLASKLILIDSSHLKNPYEPAYHWFRPSGILYSLPIMSLAFSAQTQLFLLHDSLAEPNIKTVQGILTVSLTTSCVVYILVGSLGYMTFNAAYPVILGDLTAMYPDTPSCNVVRCLLVLSVAVSFPVIAYPCRVSIFSLLYLKQSVIGSPDLPVTGPYIPDAPFRVITVAIVAGTLAGGVLLPNVEFVLGITGALTGSFICYILPAGFFLATFKSSGRAAAMAILLVGLLSLCVSSLALLAQHGSEGGGGHHLSMASVQGQTALPPGFQRAVPNIAAIPGLQRTTIYNRRLMRWRKNLDRDVRDPSHLPP